MGLTVLSLLTLRTMGLSAIGYGLLLTTVGFAALLGATLAPGLGSRLGTGWAVIASLVLYPPAWLLVAAAPSAPALLFVAMVLHGFAGGVENPNSLGYRQAVTPDGLLGRVNGIIRSANRTMGALGALLGGAVVGLVGTGPALATVIVLFTFALGIAALSPLRTARLPG